MSYDQFGFYAMHFLILCGIAFLLEWAYRFSTWSYGECNYRLTRDIPPEEGQIWLYENYSFAVRIVGEYVILDRICNSYDDNSRVVVDQLMSNVSRFTQDLVVPHKLVLSHKRWK